MRPLQASRARGELGRFLSQDGALDQPLFRLVVRPSLRSGDAGGSR
jgi:hypothetical protein